MNEEQIKELAETSARSRSNTKRLDKVEEQQRLMYEMNRNIAVIAEQTKDTKTDVQSLKTDVEEIKSKPNKLYDKVVAGIATGVVGAIIGAVMALVLR